MFAKHFRLEKWVSEKDRPLYRGYWPSVVSRLAKYSVKFITDTHRGKSGWKITVFYEEEQGLRFLAVEGSPETEELVDKINAAKIHSDGKYGGVFYINEYKHVIAPVRTPSGNHVRFICKWKGEFKFPYSKSSESPPEILGPNPKPDMVPGSRWDGPRPGIPYILAAGGSDIYYKMPALTETDPPTVRERMTMQVHLSRVLDPARAAQAAAMVLKVRNHQGGRFYVNEVGAMFTPVATGDGNGIDYVYCGDINLDNWFPEPHVPTE